MAILNGIIKKMTGSAGQLTFKTVNGQTVVSEKVTAVKNSRTAGQQRQRMKWVNIIRMYSGIAPLLKVKTAAGTWPDSPGHSIPTSCAGGIDRFPHHAERR